MVETARHTEDRTEMPLVGIVGGGFVGLCCALQLQRVGYSVLVVDPGNAERAASFGNAGQFAAGEVVPLSGPGVLRDVPRWLADPLGPLAIRWRYLGRLAPWLLRFLREGRMDRVEEISRTMAALCDRIELDYQPLLRTAEADDILSPGPYIRVYESEREWRLEGYKWELRKRGGLRFELLDRARLTELEPEISDRFQFAVAYHDRPFVKNPHRLMQAFRRTVERNGGKFIEGEVVDLERSASAVTGLRLADGRHLAIDALVIAAGAWSGKLTRLLGDKVPLESERGYHAMLSDPGVRVTRSISHVARGIVIIPMETGLRIAGTVEFAGLEAPPNPARAHKMIEAAKIVLPKLRTDDPKIWMGHRPSMPDSLPIIDRAHRFRNVFYAFGHGHMGLSWAATTGRLVTSLVSDTPSNFDLAPLRLGRFLKG